MTKDVLITISGLHLEDGIDTTDAAAEPIEVLTAASYYLKNGKHYILFDEIVEGFSGTIKNKIRVQGEEKLEITKSGVTNTDMVFEKDKIHVSQYETPYGEILVGTYTKALRVEETEDDIDIYVGYELDINSQKAADCEIKINVHANGQ